MEATGRRICDEGQTGTWKECSGGIGGKSGGLFRDEGCKDVGVGFDSIGTGRRVGEEEEDGKEKEGKQQGVGDGFGCL